ncbi:flagellar hook-length control protein FliK [Accumulibacter sp.]|uniref:flagellar hook-length control protein FliK n=1 Tax=Accumulibacter sp. TaxID=2053492 RepID=UPI002626826E|nr:flagellar hook-length control protein FliK [Accumulibacter sp.]
MSIAVVSSFARAPTISRTNAGTGDELLTTAVAAAGGDFASILLGLPMASGAPSLPADTSRSAQVAPLSFALPATTDQAPPANEKAVDGEADAGEVTLPDGVVLLPVALGWNPPVQPAGLPAADGKPVVAPPEQARAEASPAKATIRLSAAPVDPRAAGGNERQASPSATPDPGEAPARFAVATFTGSTAEQAAPTMSPHAPDLVAPAVSPTTLATLPPIHLPSGATRPADTIVDLPTPLRDASWATDFGQKVLWFVGNEKQTAQLTLNPPQLGAIEVTVNVDKGNANAHFSSANAEVRGSIEAALPRLREMFASAGIDLGQVSVGSESFRQQAQSQPKPSPEPRALADAAILGAGSLSGAPGQFSSMPHGRSLVDTFA